MIPLRATNSPRTPERPISSCSHGVFLSPSAVGLQTPSPTARHKPRRTPRPADHLSGPAMVMEQAATTSPSSGGRKSSGRPEDHLAPNRALLDGQWVGVEPPPDGGAPPSPERPSSSQRSKARSDAEKKHAELHDESLNGFLVGSGPSDSPWTTKRRVERRPTLEAEGPGMVFVNGHGGQAWQSLGKISSSPTRSALEGACSRSPPRPPYSVQRRSEASSISSDIATPPTRREISYQARAAVAPEAAARAIAEGIAGLKLQASAPVAPWENSGNSWEVARGKRRPDSGRSQPLGAAAAPFDTD